MFFFEIISFVIVFPLCWWLGGRIAHAQDPAPPRPRKVVGDDDEPGADVIDLAAWRRRRDARTAREGSDRRGPGVGADTRI